MSSKVLQLGVLCSIASALDLHQIPYVVGWDTFLALWGGPSGDLEMQFIIEDEHFSAAMDLAAKGYDPCTDKACDVVQKEGAYRQIPEGHFHSPTYGGTLIYMYKKSQIYWILPDLPTQAPDANDRNFMLSNDPHLPMKWDTEVPPVMMLTRLAHFETLLALMGRDVDHPNELRGIWLSILWAMPDERTCIREEDVGRCLSLVYG